MEFVELFSFFVLLPAGLGYFAGGFGPKGDVQGCAISALCALGPALAFLTQTQDADSITRAASVVVTPFIFAFMCIPAMAGMAFGRRGKAVT